MPYLPILYSQLGYNKSIDIQEQRLIYIELKEEKIARAIPPPYFETSRNVNDRWWLFVTRYYEEATTETFYLESSSILFGNNRRSQFRAGRKRGERRHNPFRV